MAGDLLHHARDAGRMGRLCIVGALVVVMLPTARAVAQPPRVTINGGPDQDGGYTWTVTNDDPSPIVYVAFPHHRADLFFPPEGWSRECTGLVNEGVKNPTGTCLATVDPQSRGIIRGSSATFRVRIAPGGAPRGTGTVEVRFADGTTTRVPGVVVSVPESLGNRFVSLIGLGLIVLVIAGTKALRRGKRRAGDVAAAA